MNIQPLAAPLTAKTEERTVQGAEAVSATAGDKAKSGVANPSREQLNAAVKHINKSLPASSSLEFSIDNDSKQTVVKNVDTNTKEVLRQIPTLEALEIAKSLDKMMGLLISQKA